MLPLQPGLHYLAFDFETTGLDPEKDEPIQIGIVSFDHTGKILQTFQSLIKPQKSLQELKTIVGFVTGLKIEDLDNAPTFEELKSTIAPFFEQPCVIIGHNIGFDINFFKKYLPRNEQHLIVDTFPLSQTCIPYAQSYALETLVTQLQDQEGRKQSLQTFFPQGIKGDAHDALVDTQSSMVLFGYCMQLIQDLLKEYPLLSKLFGKTSGVFSQIFSLENKEIDTLELPALKKISPQHTKFTHPSTIDLEGLSTKEKYYIWNESIEQIVLKLLQNKKIILAFSHKSKLEIVKKILQKNHYDDIGFLKEEQDFDPVMIKAFLNKVVLDDQEIAFVIKYLVHHKKGYGILHITTPAEYKIFFALKTAKKIERKNIILTTHSGLLSYQYKKLIPEEYSICFFDHERWYKSTNSYLSQPFDLYTLLTLLEQIHYKYQFLNPEAQASLQEFITFVSIFIGVRYAEITQRRKGRQEYSLACDALVADGQFRKPSHMLPEFKKHFLVIKEFLQPQDQELIEKELHNFLAIIDGPYTIEKRMYQQSDFFYLFRATYAYINYQEFLDIFADKKILSFSHQDSELKPLTTLPKTLQPFQGLRMTTSQEIISYLWTHTHKSIGILSYSKEKSKDLFQQLLTQGYDKQYKIVAENITWGVGKTLSIAKNAPTKIIIGGFEYLLTATSQEISFDIIIFFNIVWNISEVIYHDIAYYGSQ